MAYRAFFGVCVASFMFAACSDDETVSSGTPADGGSTGGANTGTGGARTGGGPGTGGRATGGGGASTGGGGASTGGGGGAGGSNPDAGDGSAGDSSAGTGGTDAGAGGANTGGANTDGATTDGGSCGVLSACCTSLSGMEQGRCNRIANAGNAASCTAVEAIYCGDGGPIGPPGDAGGGDAFVNCTALAACCSALADGGRAARNCNRVVAIGNNDTCNTVSTRFCN